MLTCCCLCVVLGGGLFCSGYLDFLVTDKCGGKADSGQENKHKKDKKDRKSKKKSEKLNDSDDLKNHTNQ